MAGYPSSICPTTDRHQSVVTPTHKTLSLLGGSAQEEAIMLVRTSRTRRALLIFASACLVTAPTVHASAGESGLEGLFQKLFAPAPAAQQPMSAAPEQAYRGSDSERWYDEAQPNWRRSARRRSALSAAGQAPSRSRDALRSRGETASPATQVKAKAAENKAAVLAKSGQASAALMQDSTLRKGDIVITAHGPKVFAGSQKAQHTAADFEDARRSSSLDGKTRELLTQMTASAGAATGAPPETAPPSVTSAQAVPSLKVASIW